MLDDRLGQRFERKELLIFGGNIRFKKVRQHHMDSIGTIGDKIKSNITLRSNN